MLTDKKISITIPAHNEEETIKFVVRNALSSVKKITDKYELVLVDDGSVDKTGQIMDMLEKELGNKVAVIHHRKNKGFSGAMKSCYQHATGDYIFLGPADGQFDYSELELFVKEIVGKDIVVAYRMINEEKLIRKFCSFFFHLLSRLLFGIKLREFSSCILYTKKVRNSVKIEAHPFSCLFLPELIYKSMKRGYKIGEVPIHFYKRKGGKQKGTSLKMIITTMFEMLKLWLEINLRL